MLNDHILEAIDNVENTQDFNFLIRKWQLSDAPNEFKELAIRELRATKPQFDTSIKFAKEEVYKDIKNGAADIDDIGN